MKLLLLMSLALAGIGAVALRKPPPPDALRTCDPYAEVCPACKDCTACKHCHELGGKCSVCFKK